MAEKIIAKVADLRPRKAIKFSFREDGIQRYGFVVAFEGQVVAYENVCRHIPISLDYGDGQFFTQDGQHFICQTHGATYEPLTGLCIAGPCVGATLRKLDVRVENGVVFLQIPAQKT
jgi:nitrite reductase/ring-hydroxylating ferredoxin subunit